MFKPARMCKLRAIALRKDLRKTIRAMHEYGNLQVEQIKIKEMEKDTELPEHQKLTETAMRLEGMIKKLGTGYSTEKFESNWKKPVLGKQETEKLEKEISRTTRQLSEIERRQEELAENMEELKIFRKFSIDFSLLDIPEIKTIAGLIESQNLAMARMQLKHAANHYAITQKEHTKNLLVVLVGVERNKAEKAVEALEKTGFKQLALPKSRGKPGTAIKNIEGEAKKLLEKKSALEKKIKAISEKHGSRIALALAAIEIEKDRSGITKKFGMTSECFAFEAYLQEKNFSEAKKILEEKLSGNVFVEKIGAEELEKSHADVPVMLENPKAISQFEYIIGFMSLPKSFELDPTIIFTIFFPVFYGMMLGDAGYGAISLLIASWLKKRFSKSEIMVNIANLWTAVAITTIFFGLIYDEFLGYTHHELLKKIGTDVTLYHGFERLHEIETLLSLTIIAGVISIASGFLLGVVNAVMEKNRKHATARLAWFFAVTAGTIAVSGAMFNSFSQETTMVSGAILLASIAAIIKTEGIVGVIEVPSVAGNILSFARILAVGLASVVAAVTINKLLEPRPEQGILLLLTLPLFLAAHLLNTFIGMFEALIQGARLNFVELFSKFFEGGGKQFIPFSARNTLNKENK